MVDETTPRVSTERFQNQEQSPHVERLDEKYLGSMVSSDDSRMIWIFMQARAALASAAMQSFTSKQIPLAHKKFAYEGLILSIMLCECCGLFSRTHEVAETVFTTDWSVQCVISINIPRRADWISNVWTIIVLDVGFVGEDI